MSSSLALHLYFLQEKPQDIAPKLHQVASDVLKRNEKSIVMIDRRTGEFVPDNFI